MDLTANRTSDEHAARVFLDQQNSLRGIIADLRARGFRKDRVDPVQFFISALSARFLDARSKLNSSQFDEYLDWSDSTLQAMIGSDLQKPGHAYFLGGFSENIPVVSIDRELIWIAKSIRRSASSINSFLILSEKLESAIVGEDKFSSLDTIDQITEKFGHSYWSVQLQIYLNHIFSGLESQKKFTDKIRSKHSRGTLGYVAYYTSVRSEDRTSWARFTDMVEERIKKTPYSDGLRNYLKYRLALQWPKTDEGIADILRHEQCCSPIDIYETFIAAAQHIVSRNSQHHLKGALSLALDELIGVADFRLEKLRLAIGKPGAAARLPVRSAHISNAMLADSPKAALRASRREQAIDPWQAIYGAAARSHFVSDRGKPGAKGQGVEHLVASILRRDGSSVSTAGQLEKLSRNLSGIPFFAGIRDFYGSLYATEGVTHLAFGDVGLNSRYVGIEEADLPISRDQAPSIANGGFNATEVAWGNLSGNSLTGAAKAIPIAAFMKAVHRTRQGEFGEALSAIAEMGAESKSQPLARLKAGLLLECHIALSDKAAVINLIADEAATNELSPAFLPIDRALGAYRWPDFRGHVANLSALIALDALWRSTDKDSVATMLRYAFSYQLKGAGLTSPTQLADIDSMFSRERLLYYLRLICVPNVMDMSSLFPTSRSVTEERQSVCATLISIDPGRTDDYASEVYEITNRIVIADGLRLVDGSRIHVDTDAITRWARKNLEEDFDRYFDLVRAGIGSTGDFDQILREVFSTIGARQVFFTPDDQSDAILADILYRIREEFLTNADYGLDYFLSKRVRHQSFIGLIRGPLEFANVITSRETEFSSYKPNSFWLQKLESLSHGDRERAQKCFWDFSESFDASLIKLKDQQLQIRNADAPHGLFDIELTTKMLFIVRSVMQTGFGFDDFLRMCYTLFWGALEPSLSEARLAIGTTLKQELHDLFDLLRAGLHEVASGDPALPELSSAIGVVSAEVQRRLDEAAAWFVRPEGQLASHKFTLRQSLEIAVESALKSHRAFEPDMDMEVSGDVELQTPDLLLLTDAIFIALDNIKAHSQVKRNVPVKIRCSVNEPDDLLILEVRNQIAHSVDKVAVEERLDRIRTLIASGEVSKRARKEGGSGFLKIAAALRHSAEGSIRFRVEQNEFVVSIKLKPAKYTVAVLQVS